MVLVVSLVSVFISVVQAGNPVGAIGNRAVVQSPLTSKSPNLVFTGLTVNHADYGTGHLMGASITVRYYSTPSLQGGGKARQDSVCNRPYNFPLQLLVKNSGQADYIPKSPGESVTINIGTWNAVLPLKTLLVGKIQTYNFTPTLASGSYILQAHINTSQNNPAAPNGPQVHDMTWPLNVVCDTKAVALPPVNVGFKPGKVLGMIWWDKTVLPRNLAGLNTKLNGGFNGCAGLAVMLGHPTAFGPNLGNLQYLRYAERGNVSECQFEFTQVPVDTDLAVGYTVSPGMFKVPVVSPGQSHSFKIPGSGSTSYSVRMELQPNIHPQLHSP